MESEQMRANQKALRKTREQTCMTKSTNTGGMPVESNQHPSSPLWLPHQLYVSTTPLPGVPDTFNQVTQVSK
jgi:hypothetical protein